MTDSQPARGCDVLLPCPHCGREPELKQIGSDIHGPLWSVRCWKCVHVHQRDAVIAKWNTRVEPVGRGDGEVVTAKLVGDERMRNDAMAHAMVEARMTKDDAIRMLLVERDRLIKWAVDVEKTRPRMYVIRDGVKPEPSAGDDRLAVHLSDEAPCAIRDRMALGGCHTSDDPALVTCEKCLAALRGVMPNAGDSRQASDGVQIATQGP